MPYEIEGMTLLDQTTIEAVTRMQTWAIIIVTFSAFFAFVFIMAALVYWGEEMSSVYLALAAVVTILFLSMLFIPDKIVLPEYIKYSVTIDDGVSMNEFLEHYEIIEQHGKSTK